MAVTREAPGLRMMRDSPLIERVLVTESSWSQTTRCPLNWMTSPRAKLRKKLRAGTVPFRRRATHVSCLMQNPGVYFIFNELANKPRTDKFSIGEVAINFFHPE